MKQSEPIESSHRIAAGSRSACSIFFLAAFVVLMGTPARSETNLKQLLADAVGIHGTIASITRFTPFEMNDALTEADRDLSFEYIEVTAFSKAKKKLIYKGNSEFLPGDEVCILFKPLNYGSCLLGDLLDEDDPGKKALPLAKIRIESDGFIIDPPKGVCLLCSDEKKCIYLLATDTGKGSCKKWTDKDGVVHMMIEDESKNRAEATAHEGCGAKKGSGSCLQVIYRDY